MELGNTRTLTKEETAELYAVREATLDQLVILADKCGFESNVAFDANGKGQVKLKYVPNAPWQPQDILSQSHLLLAAVIAEGDCRLFYDHEVNEFFIYQYQYNDDNAGPLLAHHNTLIDTVFAAAMELWFPEE